MMGSLEAWLLLRSLRTLHIRVAHQSNAATALVKWLSNASDGQAYDGIPAGVLAGVLHSSLQKEDSRGFKAEKQMEGGYNPTFSILVCYHTALALCL
jgi:cystathionine gamma-synthase